MYFDTYVVGKGNSSKMNLQKVKKGNDWTKDTSRFPEFVSYFSTERNARKCTSKMQKDVMMSKCF